ncbi:MAG: hypothetical protein ACI4ET_11940, partial [Bilifractor sp.]
MKKNRVFMILLSLTLSMTVIPAQKVRADTNVDTDSESVNISVFPYDGDPPETPLTYPQTDLNKSDINSEDINTDKNIPGIQTRIIDPKEDDISIVHHKELFFNNSIYVGYGKKEDVARDMEGSDPIIYNGVPITFDFLNGNIGDSGEEGGNYIIDVTGPHVQKKLKTSAHQKVVKEYMGYVGPDYLVDPDNVLAADGWGSYQTNMFTEHLAVRLNHPYGNTLGIDIPFEIVRNYKLEDLKKYNSASEFVHATGFMCSPQKYTEDREDLEFMINTVPYKDNGGDIAKMMEKETKEKHAEGWGIRKKTDYRIVLDIDKNSPHLKNLNEYWTHQDWYDAADDPLDMGTYYEYTLATYLTPLDYEHSSWGVYVEKQYIEKNASLDSSDNYKVEYKPVNRKDYFFYFPFSCQQAIDAWAAEMDSWEGHWDRFINGTIYTEDHGKDMGNLTGYDTGNWGDTWFGVQFGQHVDNIPDYYEYSINGPGEYTITLTGTNHYKGSLTKKFTVEAGQNPSDSNPKGEENPQAESIDVSYRTHVQDYGTQDWVYNGGISGTTGQSKRLEGIWIQASVTDEDQQTHDIPLIYQTHVQNYGWQDWKSSGEMAGTSGQALRLEAIRINFGDDAYKAKYDIYYRVHAQNFGWLAWAKNG